MADEVYEVFSSRTLTVENGKPNELREYVIRGPETEQTALDAMYAHADCPLTLSLTVPDEDGVDKTYTLRRSRAEVREFKTNGRFGWNGTVRYSVRSSSSGITWTQAPDIRWSFSMHTDTVIAKLALGAQRRYGNGGNDCGQNINVVNRDGFDDIQGVPVLVPSGVLRGAKTYTGQKWNTIVARAKNLMCKVNNASFSAGDMTFGDGELLMAGAEARLDSERNVEVEFQFLYSPNTSGSTEGISWHKAGWEAFWPYTTIEIDNGNRLQRIGSIYVAPVYETASFVGLFAD